MVNNFCLMIRNSTYFLVISMVYFFILSCSSPTSIEDNENLDGKLQNLQPATLVLPSTTPVISKITKIPTAIPLPSPTVTPTPRPTATSVPDPTPSPPPRWSGGKAASASQ